MASGLCNRLCYFTGEILTCREIFKTVIHMTIYRNTCTHSSYMSLFIIPKRIEILQCLLQPILCDGNKIYIKIDGLDVNCPK